LCDYLSPSDLSGHPLLRISPPLNFHSFPAFLSLLTFRCTPRCQVRFLLQGEYSTEKLASCDYPLLSSAHSLPTATLGLIRYLGPSVSCYTRITSPPRTPISLPRPDPPFFPLPGNSQTPSDSKEFPFPSLRTRRPPTPSFVSFFHSPTPSCPKILP